MPEEKEDSFEERLRRIGEAFRRGVQKAEPIAEKEMVVVRNAIRSEWESSHKADEEKKHKERKAQEVTDKQEQVRRSSQRKSQSDGQEQGY